MRWLRSGVLATLAVLGSASARADVWVSPCPEAFVSAHGQWRLVVVPGGSDSFERCRREQIRLGLGRPRSPYRARGSLERLEQGRWLPVWQAWLVDDPGSAVVSDDGRVATFGRSGRDSSTVVVYDRQGHQVRALALTDFLPKFYVHVLPRSVSYTNWGGRHAFSDDGEQLVLRVRAPSLDEDAAVYAGKPPEYIELALDARSGAVLPSRDAAWAQALLTAGHADAKRCAAEKIELAAYLARLSPDARVDESKRYGADGRDEMGACGPPPPDLPEPEPKAAN